MENNTPLDSVDISTEEDYKISSQGKRFGTFLIDYIIIILIAAVIMGITGLTSTGGSYAVFIPTFIGYYTIMELLLGRTIGKFLLGTIVVRSEDLKKINLSQAAGRSFSRLVPFEPFSFLGGPQGWHDNWNNTIVVDIKSLKNPNIY